MTISPLPLDPRWGLNLETQKRLVAEGEYVLFDVEDLTTNPTVYIRYPSGYLDTLGWEAFEKFLSQEPFLLATIEEKYNLCTYLSNFRHTVYWPGTRAQKIRVQAPDYSGEIFV